MLPPHVQRNEPAQCITTRFFHHSVNKIKCPIFCLKWTPEGRRLITGASTGEFTLWNALTFNFETILQAHQSGVRDMVWSHNHNWMVTCDDDGKIMYWQSNMNQVTQFEGHKDRICRLCLSPTDAKLATASEDGSIKIFDFEKCREERAGRGVHGAEVRSIAWHSTKGLVASGGRDATRALVFWDPRTANALSTLALHRNTVSDIRFHSNGNWMLTSSWDHLLKVFDLRAMKEIHHFRGHKNDVQCLALHPHHETLFASGGRDGSVLFWEVGNEQPIGSMEKAHDSLITRLDWHPVGHLLASGSNDRFVKFWTRNFPGDAMRDRYNLALDEPEYAPKGQYMRPATRADAAPPSDARSGPPGLPGMRPGEQAGESERASKRLRGEGSVPGLSSSVIPGLGGAAAAGAPGLDAGPAIPGLASGIPGLTSGSLSASHRPPQAPPHQQRGVKTENTWSSQSSSYAGAGFAPQQGQSAYPPQPPPSGGQYREYGGGGQQHGASRGGGGPPGGGYGGPGGGPGFGDGRHSGNGHPENPYGAPPGGGYSGHHRGGGGGGGPPHRSGPHDEPPQAHHKGPPRHPPFGGR